MMRASSTSRSSIFDYIVRCLGVAASVHCFLSRLIRFASISMAFSAMVFDLLCCCHPHPHHRRRRTFILDDTMSELENIVCLCMCLCKAASQNSSNFLGEIFSFTRSRVLEIKNHKLRPLAKNPKRLFSQYSKSGKIVSRNSITSPVTCFLIPTENGR
jgi:hypothetical protein